MLAIRQLLAFLLIMSLGNANGQSQPLPILKKSLNKISAFKSIRYQERFINANPLSKGDTTFGNSNVSMIFDVKGSIKAMAENTTLNNGQSTYTNLYREGILYSIDRTDSVYSYEKIANTSAINNDLVSVVSLIKEVIASPKEVYQRKDTVLNGALCYSFFFKLYDKTENSYHNYTYKYLLIDKKTLMPVYTRENGAGVMEKAGHVIGQVSVFNEQYFSAYRIDQSISNKVFAFNKAGFALKNETMLADGSIAPQFELRDMNNEVVPASKFQNKVLLVEFGATDCAANPLANPMLNRFTQQYAAKPFALVSIFTGETTGQVKKYAEANNIEFPVYLGSKKQKMNFKTVATPNFYLIDKNGRIVKGYDGYSDSLESDLSVLIDKEIK